MRGIEMKELKFGDKVLVKEDYQDFRKGQIVELQGLSKDGIHIFADDKENCVYLTRDKYSVIGDVNTRFMIVETDNYDEDYPFEKFLALPPMTREAADEIASVINRYLSDDRFWKVEPVGYKLHHGFEP